MLKRENAELTAQNNELRTMKKLNEGNLIKQIKSTQLKLDAVRRTLKKFHEDKFGLFNKNIKFKTQG